MHLLNGHEPSAIKKAIQLLKDGDIVAFPTETVYGLGANVFNPYAVAKIFEAKKRPRFDPLIVHIGEKDWIFDLAEHIPSEAKRLIDAFWPGPLTIIFKKKVIVPDIVTAGLQTVGIRMPLHPVALRLIREFKKPIAAPSANPFGYISPTKASHVAKMLGDRLPLILDGGNSVFGIESTIVSIMDKKVYIHRHGAISAEEIAAVAGAVYDKKEGAVCEAPGELPYHYAPSKPLRLIDAIDEIEIENSAFLSFGIPNIRAVSKYVKILSEKRDLREAAANFFSFLIELDNVDVEIIYSEKIPETGLGKAMMDRLRKASKKYRHTTR
jgi:L-threonylcarbamoyladenylate synthase